MVKQIGDLKFFCFCELGTDITVLLHLLNVISLYIKNSNDQKCFNENKITQAMNI